MGNLDDTIVLWVSNAWASPSADLFFRWVSDFPTFGWPLALALLAVLSLRSPRWGWAGWALALLAIGLADAGGNALKHLLEMPRPCYALGERVRQIEGCVSPLRGMPSNHALEYATATGCFAFLLRSRRWAFALGGVTAVVGLSRIYLGKHFPSQVLTGFVLGLAWGWACAALARRWIPALRALGEGRARRPAKA